MEYDFDVIVIGSGAGGATFAYACAKEGRRVLVLEKGKRPDSNAREERDTLIEKKPYDDRLVRINGKVKRLYAGGVLGGSSALYGAALLRPSPDDFHPGKYYSVHLPRSLWDWPIDYEALEPYYTEAERLYGVAGSDDDDLGPLGKPQFGYPGTPLPLQQINQRLVNATRAIGLKPFQLPLAINAKTCLRCASCAGFLCPNGSRPSSAKLLDEPIAGEMVVMTGFEAQHFNRDGTGQVDLLHVLDRVTGQSTSFRAHLYALAGGAIGSPLLLLQSGFEHPMIGRNYMYHLSPLVAGIFPLATEGDTTFIKQIGFADYYFGCKDFAHKMGIVQSLPVPGPLLMAKAAGRYLPGFVSRFLRKQMLPMTGIIEDLPNPSNRVTLGEAGMAEIQHAFSPYDRERGRYLSRLIVKLLKQAGALFCLSQAAVSDEHVAHQCGTLRFGTDPAEAVVDRDGRLFGYPNICVVDGSLFPTSLGVGPALTIIANALRIARGVTGVKGR